MAVNFYFWTLKMTIVASGFFALLDDISVLMDDVAAMTKVATKKTAGILGDDLAVNAQKATCFVSSREVPVLWAITKGSLLNKLIILPLAFAMSAFYPPAVVVVLVLGGFYLAFEGAEKILHYLWPHPHAEKKQLETKLLPDEVVALEKAKIKSAVVTDFILSVEIVIIALGAVIGKPIVSQIFVVSVVALLATVGVYGLVALIVRLDDFGLWIITKNGKNSKILTAFGKGLIHSLPIIVKILAYVGTVALLLVSGGIFAHHLPFLHHLSLLLPDILKEFLFGLVVGFVILFLVMGVKKIRPSKKEM